MSATAAVPADSSSSPSAAELDGDDMPSWPIWKSLGCDVEWLDEAQERQCAIEECVAAEDLGGLLGQRPAGADPLQQFRVAAVGRQAADLQAVRETAAAGRAKASEIAGAFSAQLGALVAQAREEDQAAMKEQLLHLREANLQEVRGRMKALGEMVDPEESKSQSEVLSMKYGEEALAQMTADMKDAAYEELIAERIQGREEAAYASAQALVQAGDLPPKLAEILAKADQLGAGEQQVVLANASKEEAQDILDALKQSVVDREQALASCEATKKASLCEGDSKRAALKKALRDLQQAEGDYRNWYVDNEALRLQVQQLRADVDSSKQEAAAAEAAWPEVHAACQEWLDVAEREAGAVREQQTEAARTAAQHAADAICAGALNARIGMELCQKVLGDKDAELASLRHDKGVLEGKVAALKDQLKQPCEGGLRAKRTQLAQQKDELSRFDAQIAACTRKRGEVERTLATAQERLDSLKALSRYGLSVEEQDLAQTAETLSEEAYGRFQCFADAEHFVEPEQPPSSASEELSKLPANLLEVFQKMLKEQRELFLLQLKADKERGKDAAGSVCGSDTGESYTVLPDNVGAAERFAIFSGASSARSSGEP